MGLDRNAQQIMKKKKKNHLITKRGMWLWPDSVDARVVAPESHKVLLENEYVRVIEVTIKPGTKEPAHTHKWPSVMIVDVPTDLRYFDEDNKVVEIIGRHETKTEWMDPERLHAVENLDNKKEYHAIRIELKKWF
ncbi:MAG TPA: hypothetical protein VJ201_09020 [Candidatus Babeliales bacterium]|nr:hypothetical protein [Candidatus Babeliales bacterium]